MKRRIKIFTKTLLCAAVLSSSVSWAGGNRTYEVTITNLTPSQPMAHLMISSHKAGMSFLPKAKRPAKS